MYGLESRYEGVREGREAGMLRVDERSAKFSPPSKVRCLKMRSNRGAEAFMDLGQCDEVWSEIRRWMLEIEVWDDKQPGDVDVEEM